jgi:hypothetical protein
LDGRFTGKDSASKFERMLDCHINDFCLLEGITTDHAERVREMFWHGEEHVRTQLYDQAEEHFFGFLSQELRRKAEGDEHRFV